MVENVKWLKTFCAPFTHTHQSGQVMWYIHGWKLKIPEFTWQSFRRGLYLACHQVRFGRLMYTTVPLAEPAKQKAQVNNWINGIQNNEHDRYSQVIVCYLNCGLVPKQQIQTYLGLVIMAHFCQSHRWSH